MTGKERIAKALAGGTPDRVPILPIFNAAYLLNATGRDPREWVTGSAADRVRLMEDALRLHPEVDGCLVREGTTDEWAETHDVEEMQGFWRITHRPTGAKSGLLPDGAACDAEGRPVADDAANLTAEPRIRSRDDIDHAWGAAPGAEEVRASHRFEPLQRITATRPGLHCSAQALSPLVPAIDACGGYVPGLMTMKSEPALFRELLERAAQHQCARFGPAREAGADSIWFTCYYGGADAIDPRDYAEIVLPYDRMVCEEAKRHGLYVLHWYLGDLMPNLDAVRQLPTDALVLEQSRKSYRIDLGEIRARVGPRFCLFGFGYEQDFIAFNPEGLSRTLREQYDAAGRDGAYIVGTPIMPANADPAAVDYYFAEARRLGADRE